MQQGTKTTTQAPAPAPAMPTAQYLAPAKTRAPQIFLDVDGVMADFDTAAEQLFGLPPRKTEAELGTPRFWVDLKSVPGGFFRTLPLMPGARELYAAVRHLNPIMLTGCPMGGWAEPQKLAWRDDNFPGVPMICCDSKDKREHMTGLGDVIVDDWPKYRTLWEGAGGIFILHTSAADSIMQLRKIGIIE